MEATRSPRRTRQWYTHVLIVVAVEFAAESARGLVLPTLFSYSEHLGGDLAFTGLLTALFSAGRFVSSLMLGALSDRISFKTLYFISGVTAIVGNALYVLPYSPHVHSKLLLGMSRFLVGFGAGNRSVCRANIAALTRIDQRISYFTMLATVVFLAYALTPGLGGVFGDIDMTVFGSEYIHFNRFTAPGFLLVALNLATLAFVAALYDDSVKRCDAPKPIAPVSSKLGPREREPATELHSPPPSREVLGGVLVFLFLNFSARGMLSVFETVNVPLYAKTVNGTLSADATVFDLRTTFLPATTPTPLAADASDVIAGASHFYLMVGLLGLITYSGVHIFGNRISDTSLLLFGFTTLLTGNGLLVVLSRLFTTGSRDSTTKLRLFVSAEVLVWSVGSPIASAVIVPAFSKLLGTRPQGTLMGVFGATASIARMSMPFLPSALSSWELLFCVNLGLCASSIFALIALRVSNVKS